VASQGTDDRLKRDIIAIGFATLGALLLASLVYGAQIDGFFPFVISQTLLLSFGIGAYLMPPVAFVLAALYGLEQKRLAGPQTIMGLALLFVVIITLRQLLAPQDIDFSAPDKLAHAGGFVGGAIAWVFLKILGTAGSYIILAALAFVGVLLITQSSTRQLLSGITTAIGQGREYLGQIGTRPLPSRRRSLRREAEKTRRRSRPRRVETSGPGVDLDDKEESSPQQPADQAADSPPDAGQKTNPATSTPPQRATGNSNETAGKPQLELISPPEHYTQPPLSLLQKLAGETDSQEMHQETADSIIKLEDTLESFGISAKVTHFERGPVLTRYEVEPERGIRVNQITRLADDLAMSLAAVDVRVEAPIPGKSAIGIEVPNEHRSIVSLRGVMESEQSQNHPGELPIALGRDIAGQPVIADLVSMPHLLIAGATGSGKSVCLHSVILSLIMRHSPEDVRLLLIDPKRVELSIYDGIPHLISPVVYSLRQAANVLHKAIREMEKRYDKFALKGVSNLNEYNELARMPKEGIIDEFEPLPRVVILIDELADLMIQARAEFEYSICRIAQLARATGIHLVVATQRPSVKIITGNIKANMPSRIALAVASMHDSRTVLDGQGAERLIGNGDMLYAPLDASKPIRMQGSFVPRSDIEKVVAYLHEQGEPDFQIIPDLPEDEEDYGAELETSDELYAAAVQYVVAEQQASVSMLQRRFKVGYARAGRLIDMMERRGVIGPHEGSKARQVLIGPGRADAALAGTLSEDDYQDSPLQEDE